MGERVRGFDWSTHPLGPPELWPAALRHGLRLMLNSRQPMWLGWGPDLHVFHNDAFAPFLGIKEAWALGTPAAKLWQEVWETLGPRAEAVMRTGASTWDPSLRLFLDRNGYVEETFQTFSCSPISDDDGSIAGMLCVVTDETDRVLAERRMALLQAVSSNELSRRTEALLFRALHAELEKRSEDLPFAIVYLFDGSGLSARRVCIHGITDDALLAPEIIITDAVSQVWPAAAILERASSIVIDDLETRFHEVPSGPWERPPRQAMVVPIVASGPAAPAGFLVAGINPFRALDAPYTEFLKTLARQIAA